MKDDVVLSVRGVSKKFCRNLKRSMLYGMKDLARNLLGLRAGVPASTALPPLRPTEFWALKDIHFDLHRGEILGIIGANGSGKSTLLRVLTGIFPPDAGEVQVRGRLGGLIALGAGFHPHMTGRENIYLNGTILGLARREVEDRFQDIVEFADIGDFLDAPVTTYSSGMYVRLGFAIAIHTLPDIVLIDEILAVGDARFQRKCLDRIRDMRKEDKSFILVSHNMQNIEAMCDRVLWLNHGETVKCAPSRAVIPEYELMQMRGDKGAQLPEAAAQSASLDPSSLKLIFSYKDFGTNEVTVKRLALMDRNGRAGQEFVSTELAGMEIKFGSSTDIPNAYLWLVFFYVNDEENADKDQAFLGARQRVSLPKGESSFRLALDAFRFTTGVYKVSLCVFDDCFLNPYTQGHYGLFTVKHEVPTMLRTGGGTPFIWLDVESCLRRDEKVPA